MEKKTILRTFLSKYHNYVYDKFYKRVLAINCVPNKAVVGESEWMERWILGGTETYTVSCI